MANKYFSDWSELFYAATKESNKILTKTLPQTMKDELRRHLHEDVYDVYDPIEDGWMTKTYEPITYQRRYELEKHIKTFIENGDTLVVTSTAMPAESPIDYTFIPKQDGAFLEMLESGHVGIWRGGFPRFPITNLQKEIDDPSGLIYTIIKNEITDRIGECAIE